MKINVKEWMRKRKSTETVVIDKKKRLQNGSYSIGITVILIAVLVIVNLLVGEIPTKYTQIDVSEQKLYTIGEQTEELVKGLDTEVILYYICQSGQEDDTIEKMLERYQELSSNIKVEKKDPVLYPNFTSNYTTEDVTDNSVIVVSKDKNKIVEYSSMYESSMDYSTYSYTTTGFDGEGQITSAISYVTSDELPILYVLEGHNESSLSSTVTAAIQKENIEIESLNLITEDAVPEDADVLMINSPKTDLSSEEATKIITYLEAGGKAIIFSDYTTEDMTNFDSVLENYGVSRVDGVVIEGDSSHCISQAPYYLVPNIESTDITSELASNNRYVLMAIAQGIQKLDAYRDTLTIESLLTTSSLAYSKSDVQNMQTYEKEDGDIVGAFDIGVAITEEVGEEKTQIVYYSSSTLLEDTMNQQVSGGNLELLMNSISWMCEHEVTVSIASKSTQVSYLTLTAASANLWSIISMGVIPFGCLAIGGVIWFKRRKK